MTPVQRFSSVAVAAIFLMGAATACSSEVEKHLSYHHQEFGYVSLTEVYGQEWEEFAVQCPGSNHDEVRKNLELDESTVKDNSTNENTEYLYLRSAEGEVEVKELESDRISLCPIPNEDTATEEPAAENNAADEAAREIQEFTGFDGWQPADEKFHVFRPDPKAAWRVIVDPVDKLDNTPLPNP